MAEGSGKAKYFVLMEWIKEEILKGNLSPGQKLMSENEMAETFKVSRHTVRKALSILEQEGYITAVHGKGTFCSNIPKSRRNSKNIGVIITYLSDYIFPMVIKGIDHVFTSNGYSILLKNTGNSRKREAESLEEMLKKNIDGLIIEPSKSQIYCRHSNLYRKLEEYKLPYVFIQGCYPKMKDKPHILMDDCLGGYLATRHLLEQGHLYIAGIFKADDHQGTERHKGYVKALQKSGILYEPDLVIWFHTEDRGVKPSEAVTMMLESNIRIDGIVCYNDQIALEVIHAIEATKRNVPEDISVTGYDDSVIARNSIPKLTTIAHPQEKLGEAAACLLLEKMNGISDEESKVERILQPKLIVRDSTRSSIVSLD